MKQKHLHYVLNILYESAKNSINISSKEDFYRLLFKNTYALAEDEMYSNDTLRRVTSGNQTIPGPILKKLHTEYGFEQLCTDIELKYLPNIHISYIIIKLKELLDQNKSIPEAIKLQIKAGLSNESTYQISKSIAAVLVCMNYCDIMNKKRSSTFINIDFMRFKEDKPIPKYPKYITEKPENGVSELFGRQKDIDELFIRVVQKPRPLLISSVGGIGKTELVKKFLNILVNINTEQSNIEKIAWIPYISQDLRQSCKQALHLQCELNDVWIHMQNIADDYRERLLLVVDNIEQQNDDYLRKLSTLSCHILVTSRFKNVSGFDVLLLDALNMSDCRSLFYKHYKFSEKDNEIVTDIIDLTARHTITIVFLAKAAYLEGLSLYTLYQKLIEKGFKLSEEDVSCEHEKLHDDQTIIQQMCILFSILGYKENDKSLLTYISVIPNLQFELSKAKRWFKVKSNSILLRLHEIGMLEHSINNRTHIYWMHSVIAAAVREQQKKMLYETARPFVDIVSEELNFNDQWGQGYKKAYLVPFSWSIADIMEEHWNSEKDSVFLIRLYYVCFECGNYAISKKLLDKVLEIDLKGNDYAILVRDYKCKCDLLLKYEDPDGAIEALKEAANYLYDNSDNAYEWSLLWQKLGIAFHVRGDYAEARKYYEKALETDLKIEGISLREISTDYSSIASLLRDSGGFKDAYSYIKKAIEIDDRTTDDSEQYMNYYYLAGICSDLVNQGYLEFVNEAEDSFERVISFREKNLSKTNTDLADIYHEYSLFLYYTDNFETALYYNQMAYEINMSVYSEYSVHVLQNLNTRAIIFAENGNIKKAIEIHQRIFEILKEMRPISADDFACFHYNYAEELLNIKDYNAAIEHYLKSVQGWSYAFSNKSIKLFSSYFGLGDCYFILEQYPEAIEYYQKAIEVASLRPDKVIEASCNLAACYQLLGHYENGISVLNEALTLYRNNKIASVNLDVEIHIHLYNAYLLNSQTDNAKEAYQYAKQAAEMSGDKNLIHYVHNFDISKD